MAREMLDPADRDDRAAQKGCLSKRPALRSGVVARAGSAGHDAGRESSFGRVQVVLMQSGRVLWTNVKGAARFVVPGPRHALARDWLPLPQQKQRQLVSYLVCT
jgi:hypothetical protein